MTTTARITRTTTSTTQHFTRNDGTNTTSVDVKRIHETGAHIVIIEAWRNSNPHRPYYSHRAAPRTRADALSWVRTALPLPIAL